jgi:hypothetical protein
VRRLSAEGKLVRAHRGDIVNELEAGSSVVVSRTYRDGDCPKLFTIWRHDLTARRLAHARWTGMHGVRVPER